MRLHERICRKTPFWLPAPWGRPPCSTTTASGCAAWCWRKADRNRMSPSWHARSGSRRSARSTTPPASPIRATPSSSMAPRATCICGRCADLEAAYAERVRLRARRQQQYQALRDLPCVTKDGEEITLLINAGLSVDLPHIADTGAAGIGLFRTELQFMVAPNFPRAERAIRALSRRARCRRRQAGHLSHARYRRRQGAALYAQCRRGEPGAGLARHPSRSRPAGTAAHAIARAVARRRRPLAEDHVPDGRDGRRNSTRPRIWSSAN